MSDHLIFTSKISVLKLVLQNVTVIYLIFILFSHLADAFIQSDLQMRTI